MQPNNFLIPRITFPTRLNNNLFKLMQRVAKSGRLRFCSILYNKLSLTPLRCANDLKIKHGESFDHALIFIIRGVYSNWTLPIAVYFCKGTLSPIVLKTILKKVVPRVFQAGLLPIALVCNNGSLFRKTEKMLKQETQQKRKSNGERDDGTVEVCGHKISVLYDPPDLLLRLRNNFFTRNMVFEGSIAKWDDIVHVYKIDGSVNPRQRAVDKLTNHHVLTTKINKTTVSVAAETLSEKTSAMLYFAAAIRQSSGEEYLSLETTGNAIAFIDKLFDSVNGSKLKATYGRKKMLRRPVSLNFKHYKFWRSATPKLKDTRFVGSTSLHPVEYSTRPPCLDGWITTLKSFQRIAKQLLKLDVIDDLYARMFNQEPLEKLLRKIKATFSRNNYHNTRFYICKHVERAASIKWDKSTKKPTRKGLAVI